MQTHITVPAGSGARRPSGGAIAKVRPHDWAAVVLVAAGVLCGVFLLRGRVWSAAACALIAVGAAFAARTWSRKYPGPMPYHGWWTLLLPRGRQSVVRLAALLQPRAGQRTLEIGPGVGVYSLPIATALLPDGRLDVLDVQEEMLGRLTTRAHSAGVDNIVATQGDAQRLPYPDASFDAAYLTSVLGEIPDQAAALRELRRVLKPGGRLVIGEFLIDPDYVSPTALRETAAAAGFAFERRLGPALSYFALFSRPAE
jgi:SAM-dependent methyltransferase